MDIIKAYLRNPATRISFIIFVFWLWGLWATTNTRIANLEEKCQEVDTVKAQMYEIQASLAQIHTDIQWIKLTLQK